MPAPGYHIQSLFRILAQHAVALKCAKSLELPQNGFLRGNQELNAGLLCACLPTEESPGLPFHVNADFFPSNDRKHVILGDDYQSQWNRAALLAAARTVAEATPRLTTMLGAEHFWHLASALRALSFDGHDDSRDGVWAEFWSALEVALRQEAVVLTSSGDWTTASSGVSVLLQREEVPNKLVLEGIGLKLVAEDLRRYQTILRSIGVPVLDVEVLCSTLTSKGLDRPIGLDDLPHCLKSTSGRAALWAEIAILLERRGRTPHAKHADEERLCGVSLAPSFDKSLRPCRDVYSADAPTVQLFGSLGLGIHYLDQSENSFGSLNYLCSPFRVKDAVQVLTNIAPSSIDQLWKEGHLNLTKLIAWFENRRTQIVDDEDMCQQLAALPIYPSADRLHPLNSLVLPGGFNDHLGLADIVDVDVLGGRRDFLVSLGVAELDFGTYVLEHLPKALYGDGLDPTVKQEVVNLLADHLGELIDDGEAHQALSSITLVICTDGEYRSPGDCYFPDDVVQEVLGNDANIAVLPEDRGSAVRELLTWLGVESGPRIGDIVQMVRRIAGGPYSFGAVVRMRKIVAHLGGRFGKSKERPELNDLRSIEWLPARGDTNQWHKPSSLYAPYRSHLFESQGAILDVPAGFPHRDFLEFLGVRISPSVDLVAKHLRHCVALEAPVNNEVYRFLNDNSDNPAIEQLRSTKCLWLGHAYRFPSHDSLVKSPCGPK